MRQVEDDERRRAPHQVEQHIEGLDIDRGVGLERAGRGEQPDVLVVLGQEALEEHLVEPLRMGQRVLDALLGFEVEGERHRAEGEIEVEHDDVVVKRLGERPCRVVRHGAAARAALGAHERDDPTERRLGRIAAHRGDRLEDLLRRERRHQIVAHSLLNQGAIYLHVVFLAQDHDLRAGLAHLRQAVDLLQHGVAVLGRLDDDQVGRRVVVEEGDGVVEAARFDVDRRLLEPAVAQRLLDRGACFAVVDESGHGSSEIGLHFRYRCKRLPFYSETSLRVARSASVRSVTVASPARKPWITTLLRWTS